MEDLLRYSTAKSTAIHISSLSFIHVEQKLLQQAEYEAKKNCSQSWEYVTSFGLRTPKGSPLPLRISLSRKDKRTCKET